MIEHAALITQAASSPWAITPDYLDIIRAVLSGEQESPEALSTRFGRPLTNTRQVTVRDGVAVVPITGPIFRRENLFTEIYGLPSTDILATDFQRAVDSSEVKAIVLDISSPGGIAAGIPELAESIFEQRGAKPIVAYVEDIAMSAAYWLATAASEIVLSPAGMVGSIGAVGGLRIVKDEGRIEVVSRQSPKKRMDPTADETIAEIQTQIDDIAQVFIDAVALYRDVGVETVLTDFGQGGSLVGAKALAAGMVDRLGSLEKVIAGLSGTTSRGRSFMATANYKASDITRDVIAQDFPEVAAELRAEGVESAKETHQTALDAVVEAAKAEAKAEGLAEGAQAERDRIAALDSLSMPGCEALIEGFKADGKTTAPEASMQIVAHMKASQGKHLDSIKKDSPAPLDSVEPGTGGDETFEALVASHQAAGLSKGQAMAQAVRDNPDAHQAYIRRINNGQAA